MLEGTKRTAEKINTLQEFTLLFWQNQILIGSAKIPLGQCTTEVLNLSDDTHNPDNEKEYLIAERMVFRSIGAFLHADFFRALMQGHCPRKCHNCGTYFLPLSGHNTCYCANLAPKQKNAGETKTCREIGVHMKEAQKKGKRTPAQQEYDKVYNRLKTRKKRGKISLDEWNRKVAEAISYI